MNVVQLLTSIIILLLGRNTNANLCNLDYMDYLASLNEELDLRCPMILAPSKKRLVSMIKHFSKHDEISTMIKKIDQKECDKIIVANQQFLTSDILLSFSHKKMLVILENLAIEKVQNVFRIAIDQEVYFYSPLTCSIHEFYEVNGVKVLNLLGWFTTSDDHSFKLNWNENLPRK